MWAVSSVCAECGTPALSVMKCLSPTRTTAVSQGTVLVRLPAVLCSAITPRSAVPKNHPPVSDVTVYRGRVLSHELGVDENHVMGKIWRLQTRLLCRPHAV